MYSNFLYIQIKNPSMWTLQKTTWIDLFCNSLQIEDSRKCSIRRKIEEYTVISR